MPETLATPVPSSPRTGWRLLAAASVTLQLTACASAAAPIAVFAPAGTRQCEAASGDPQAAAVARLARAGIDASSTRCGHDGRLRAAMCGLPDGRIVIVDIAPGALDEARAAGWKPLAEAPDAVEQACR